MSTSHLVGETKDRKRNREQIINIINGVIKKIKRNNEWDLSNFYVYE